MRKAHAAGRYAPLAQGRCRAVRGMQRLQHRRQGTIRCATELEDRSVKEICSPARTATTFVQPASDPSWTLPAHTQIEAHAPAWISN